MSTQDERLEDFGDRLEAVEQALARLKATPGEVVEFQQPDGGVIRLIYDVARKATRGKCQET